jgi:hypothetical protein
MGNVFGETPNTAGEDARAPQYSGDLAATVFMEVLHAGPWIFASCIFSGARVFSASLKNAELHCKCPLI